MDDGKRIRKRESYRMWEFFYKFLETHDTIEDIMLEVHRIMDNRHMFGYEQHANWSKESLQLLLEDTREST